MNWWPKQKLIEPDASGNILNSNNYDVSSFNISVAVYKAAVTTSLPRSIFTGDSSPPVYGPVQYNLELLERVTKIIPCEIAWLYLVTSGFVHQRAELLDASLSQHRYKTCSIELHLNDKTEGMPTWNFYKKLMTKTELD